MMTPQARTAAEESVRRQANYWVARKHSGEFSEREQSQFDRWRNRSVVHQRAYDEAEAFWQSVEKFAGLDFPELTAARRQKAERRGADWPWAIAHMAGVTLLAGVITFQLSSSWFGQRSVQTVKGQLREVTLDDGSHIVLNTDTVIRIDLTQATRIVYLDRGEALFTVTHDFNRPFAVVTANGKIQDLGTRFNVRIQNQGASIAVVEGLVRVTSTGGGQAELKRGEQIFYGMDGRLLTVQKVDLAKATQWLNGELSFKSQSLEDVLLEMTRYHDMDVRFDDPRLKTFKVSGVFKTRDLDTLLASAEASLPIKVQRHGRQIVISRSEPSRMSRR